MPTMIDGREVASDSEDWRHECEARSIMALPTTVERRVWLEQIETSRGKAEADRLRNTIRGLWDARNHNSG